MRKSSSLLVVVGTLALTTLALDNGLGLVPPMGYNTWRAFQCTYNETILSQQASLVVSLGLRDLGYNYFNVDDCWSLAARDPNGHLQADPAKFPSSLQTFSKKIKSMNLKFGLFSAAGVSSCNSGAGSLTYEQIDAQDFAQWGVDYLKYGDCNGLGIP
jgi:alpha-galactosidase